MKIEHLQNIHFNQALPLDAKYPKMDTKCIAHAVKAITEKSANRVHVATSVNQLLRVSSVNHANVLEISIH